MNKSLAERLLEELGAPETLTNKRIAEHFGISANQAASTKYRARNLMKYGKERPGRGSGGVSGVRSEGRKGGEVKPGGRRYLISCACRGAMPHVPFIKRMQAYADFMGAEIVFVEVGSHNKALEEWSEGPLHPSFYCFPLVNLGETFELSDLIRVSAMNIKPQQIDPLTGLHALIDDGSFIVGSPKLRYKLFASSANKLPKVAASTGCATLPNYLPNRIGQLAKKTHSFGFVFLEIMPSGLFHLRQVEADESGEFFDAGRNWKGEPVRPEAIVLGDWHTEALDPKIREETHRLVASLRPERIVFHDIFDGWSINHHETKNLVGRYRARKSLDLVEEIRKVSIELRDMHKACPEADLVVVKSNHDEFLSRLIESGNLRDHVRNLGPLYTLGGYYCDGEEPLSAGVIVYGVEGTPHATWLARDDDYQVCGYELGHHGDLGANGSRGTPRQTAAHTGSAIQGHTHTPERIGRTLVVGTSTYLRLNYNRGPGSWMNCHGLVYSNGTAQLLPAINGDFGV